MTIKLPTPGFDCGRNAHNGEVIQLLAESNLVTIDLVERLVGLHDISTQLIAFIAERCGHQPNGRCVLLLIHFFKTDAPPRIYSTIDIRPTAPLGMVDRILSPERLRRRQRAEQLLGSPANR